MVWYNSVPEQVFHKVDKALLHIHNNLVCPSLLWYTLSSVLLKEEVYAMADKILESILTEDMSEYDKAYAIYKWTRDNISYDIPFIYHNIINS